MVKPHVVLGSRGPQKQRNGRNDSAGATQSSNGSNRAYNWSADHKKQNDRNDGAGAMQSSNGSNRAYTGPRTTKRTGMTVQEQRSRLTGPTGPITRPRTTKKPPE
jgi:hypothetical protein